MQLSELLRIDMCTFWDALASMAGAEVADGDHVRDATQADFDRFASRG